MLLFNPYKLTIYQGFHNREELKRYFRSTGLLASLLVSFSGLFLFSDCAEKAEQVFPQATGSSSIEIEDFVFSGNLIIVLGHLLLTIRPS
jgi:hypothetical protein